MYTKCCSVIGQVKGQIPCNFFYSLRDGAMADHFNAALDLRSISTDNTYDPVVNQCRLNN